MTEPDARPPRGLGLVLGLGAAVLSDLLVWRAIRAIPDAGRRRSLFARLPRLLRRWVRPRLGTLRHHAPRPLVVPRRYRATAHPRPAPRISLVTPCLDQARFIAESVSSVLAQDYPELDYAVYDGGSTDGTLAALAPLRTRLAHLESRADAGQAAALNDGFRASSGEIMGWLNADDVMLPGALRYVASYFAAHPEVDVVYGHRVLIDEAGREIGRWILPPHDGAVLRWADFVPQETLFWRRALWHRVGGRLDESFDFALDWELLLRFAAHGARFARLPRFLGCFRVHDRQKTSASLADRGCAEMRRLRRHTFGRPVDDEEVFRGVGRYMSRAVVYDYLWRLGLLRH